MRAVISGTGIPSARWALRTCVGAGEPDMPTPLPFNLSSSPDARPAPLQGLLIGAIVIAGLFFGREFLPPPALAILLSFVLPPPLLLLRRIKLPRVVAVS